MGTCWNCGTDVTLKDEEVKCDECGKILNYPCHSCHKWFSVYDEKIKSKRKLCGVCGFFVCPNCGTCGTDCDKDLWNVEIMKILSPEIRYDNTPNLREKINKLLEYIESIKINHDRKQCPKGVPITYAKGRIKSCVARMLGYRIKSEGDLQKFNERVKEITDKNIGEPLTINASREEGSYGQEYRDVFNYLICLGQLRKQKVKKAIDGEEIEYEAYIRKEDGQCPNLNIKNLILKQCPKCKNQLSKDSPIEYCDCYVYKKGINKGNYPKYKLKLSNKNTCQLNRGLFGKDGGNRFNKNN